VHVCVRVCVCMYPGALCYGPTYCCVACDPLCDAHTHRCCGCVPTAVRQQSRGGHTCRNDDMHAYTLSSLDRTARCCHITPIHLQVREDVTRFRYGDEQHLDEALTLIFRLVCDGV
jgi:hypothetical protein